MSPFNQIKRNLENYKIDDALVFLNYLLHASKDPKINSEIHEFTKRYPGAITDFKIEFFSKWLVVCSEFTSNTILSPKELDWPSYLRLSELYNQIEDPFVTDQKLKKEKPLNLIIRMFYQQLPGQQRIPLQCYGSASLLYETAGRGRDYSISNDFEEITGLSIKQFMQIGMALSSAKRGPFETTGTLSQAWIDKGLDVGINILKKENIRNFLDVASCDYEKFRSTVDQTLLKVRENKFCLYEFNPLKKYPFIKIHPERWVAPNPDLVIDRITSGIYYDLLDERGKSFTDNFGLIFENYIGILLRSVYPNGKILKEKEYTVKRNKKKGPADWTILDNSCAILIECKSFIPNLHIKTIASETDIEDYTKRISGAVKQVYNHINEIQNGNSDLVQYRSTEYKIVILTLGRLQAVNTIFFKPYIIEELENNGISKPSFLVLSLQEFENYLSLVERGVSFSQLTDRIETMGRNQGLEPYMEMLKQNAVPQIVAQRGKEVLNVV
jgi:hypothetical protein